MPRKDTFAHLLEVVRTTMFRAPRRNLWVSTIYSTYRDLSLIDSGPVQVASLPMMSIDEGNTMSSGVRRVAALARRRRGLRRQCKGAQAVAAA